MLQIRNEKLINPRAEFYNDSLEELYYEQQISMTKDYIRNIILITGSIFFALFIYDFISLGKFDIGIFIVRLTVLVFSILSYINIKKTNVVATACAYITFFPPILCFAHICIAFLLNNERFTYDTMTVMVIMFCTTLMPNRWVNLVFINVMMALVFLIATPFYNIISIKDFLTITMYISLTVFFAVTAQYVSNINRREKFLRERQLEVESSTDKLTGLNNRLWFDVTLNDLCSSSEFEGKFSLVMADIDFFKKINDTYGHLIGDEVLKECVGIMRENIRSTDMIARWGGEEFVIVLKGAKLHKAVEITENIRKQIEIHTFETVGKITCSFGVSAYKKSHTAKTLLNEVDELLYKSKKSGRNMVSYLDSVEN